METSKVEGVIPSCESLIELFDKRVYAMLDLYRFLGAAFFQRVFKLFTGFISPYFQPGIGPRKPFFLYELFEGNSKAAISL